MLQIAVCDDNIDELSNMVQLINLYRASKNFSCEFAIFPNGFELVSTLEKGKRFDIYCLDIIMPGFTGIDVAKPWSKMPSQLENIYILLVNFEKVYDKISDEEKKSLISSLIKEIEIFPCDEAELPLKSILFNFPVYKDGGDVCGFLWDKSTHVSTWLERIELMSFEYVRSRKHIHCVFGTIGRREHVNQL